MGHLNLKRYLISSSKTNNMQNPMNESWLVQEIWNRMWRFSPLAQHCGLFISKDVATPPHRTARVPMAKWHPCGFAMCNLCWSNQQSHWEGWHSSWHHRGAEQAVLQGGSRPYKISLMFTPLNGDLEKHKGAGNVANPSEWSFPFPGKLCRKQYIWRR